MVKKLLTVFLLAVLVIGNLTLPSLASAQTQWWRPTLDGFSEKVDNTAIPANEIFGERYTFAQVHWIVYSLVLMFIDSEISDCSTKKSPDEIRTCLETLLGANTQGEQPQYAVNPSGGILAAAGISDFMITSRPASGIGYVSSILSKVGVKTAYAQQAGYGFGTLGPIQPIWAAARNAAYSLMALAVIVLAFMVMFRTKISPQLSVSVMYAIPRVIVGFILITFSYAIAGFIIDLAYVILGIIGAVFSASGLMEGLSAVDIFNKVNDMGGGLIGLVASEIVLILAASVLLGGVGALVGVLTPLSVAGAPVVIAGLVISVFFIIILIVAVVRIFWTFLRTYVSIIFLIIALPFGALGYVVSTGGNMFTQMLRSLVAQMSVFVTVGLVIMLSHVIFWGFGALDFARNISFLNPYKVVPFYGLGEANLGLPGFTGATPSLLGAILGMVVLLMAPGIASNVREWIASGRASGRMGGLMGIGVIGMGAKLGGEAVVGTRGKELSRIESMQKFAPTRASYERATEALRKEQRLQDIIRRVTSGRI